MTINKNQTADKLVLALEGTLDEQLSIIFTIIPCSVEMEGNMTG